MKDKEITKLGLDRFKVIIGWRGKEDIASHVLAGISGGLGGQSMKSDIEISILKAVFYFLPFHICFTIDPYWKIEKKFHPVSAHIEMYKDYEIKGDPKKIIPYILYHLEEKILHKDYLPIQKTIKKIAENGLNSFINFIEEDYSKDDTSDKLFDKEYYSTKMFTFNVESEKVKINREQFTTIVNSCYPDFRKGINTLQKYFLSDGKDDNVFNVKDFFDGLHDLLTHKKYVLIRKHIIQNEGLFNNDPLTNTYLFIG